MHLGEVPSTNSGRGASIRTGSSSGCRSCIAFGARFEGHPLHRMDGNRRNDSDRRFFLLHLGPHDSARKQHYGNNKCCDDCPFARRFVHRYGLHNALPVWPVCC